ncbi:MAG: hypothetical protein B7Y45_09050 [Sphingomonas sp. 28-66-16]|nr:MAG: hypothetical protein B7Y45_09050 [Sphingomonas sp. 28-66-16]
MLGGMVAGAAMLMLPHRAAAAPIEWRLALRNVHTGEAVDALFARDGQFLPQGLAELAHGMRDWRTGEVFAIDRQLLALLVNLRETLGQPGNKAIDLISGYRSPATNGALRAAGGAHSGVATRSQHMLGKASDIHVPGVALDRLRSAAMALGKGGVGYYPRDGFVHVDTGRVRHW